MRLAKPGIWIGILSSVGVVALAVHDIDRTAPGDLSAVHGRVPELIGSENCNQCHGGWGESMADACLECHESVGAQLESGLGIHGRVGAESELLCGLCHGEHHGSASAIVNPQSFAMAGAGSPEDFDHELVGFLMEGRHLELDCTECHEHAADTVLTEGAQRFGGLDRSCSACHEDIHRGRMTLDCTSCHGQTAFDRLESFAHEEFLPLTGGHAELACAECHAGRGPHSLRQLGHGVSDAPARGCTDCHDSPHRPEFTAEVAAFAKLSESETCDTCHLPEHEDFRRSRKVVDAELHALTGFELVAPHDEATCKDCHGGRGKSFDLAHPKRSPNDCRACHEDPHGGQFTDDAGTPRTCVACHDREHFEPHEFTIEMHARTDLPLTGSHLDLECDDCHTVRREGAPRAFATLDARCETCHADAHREFFDDYLASVDEKRGGGAEPASCELCHDATSFSEFAEKRFHHGPATGLPITGAHAQTGCESCHESAEEPDENGRTFGWVDVQFGLYDGCNTCHLDPHRGQFDGSEFPEYVNGERDCARCHVASSFRAFPQGFAHGQWTTFPLEGAHAELGCTACHDPLMRADEAGRTWGRAAGTSCADCHADPHLGQFAEEGETRCERCHEDTGEFRQLVFRHDRDSRFELGDAHRDLDCATCHPAVPTGRGADVVRYRPLDFECVDCHGVQEERILRGKRRRS